jgi:hypothetical protein
VSLQRQGNWQKLTRNARLNLFRRPDPSPAGLQR